jgi:uncharacterized membrane protein YbhN (UPF0104 family)
MGGELAKSLLYSKSQLPKETFVLSVVFDKVTGLLGLLILGALGLMLQSPVSSNNGTLMGALVVLCLLVILLIIPGLGKLSSRLKLKNKFVNAWLEFGRKKRRTVAILLLGILVHVLNVVSILPLAGGLGMKIGFWDWTWIFALLSVVVLLPVTISGFGLREGTLVSFLGLFHVPPKDAVTLGLMIFVLQLSLGLIGLYFVVRGFGAKTTKLVERNG